MLIETPYYHLSKVNRNGQIFKPRVPPDAKRGYGGIENNTVKRICCSTEIDGCLKSSGKSMYHHPIFYVHKLIVDENAIIVSNENILKNQYVYDAELTKETWICSPVMLKCIGAIQIKKILQEKNGVGKIKGGKNYTYWYNDYVYEWIDLNKINQKYSKFYKEVLSSEVV